MSFNWNDEFLSTLCYEIQKSMGESVNNTVPFQTISESEFVGLPVGTSMQGTMSRIANVWISGELIYGEAGQIPRRSTDNSGSIPVVRVPGPQVNRPALCALPSLRFSNKTGLCWTEKSQWRSKGKCEGVPSKQISFIFITLASVSLHPHRFLPVPSHMSLIALPSLMVSLH